LTLRSFLRLSILHEEASDACYDLVLETDFLEAVLQEGIEFGARQGPGRAIGWLTWLAAMTNDKQRTTWCNTVSDGCDGSSVQVRRKRLDGEGIKNKVKGASPERGELEEIGNLIIDDGGGKTLSAPGDGT
jgi:hypothetical protein